MLRQQNNVGESLQIKSVCLFPGGSEINIIADKTRWTHFHLHCTSAAGSHN